MPLYLTIGGLDNLVIVNIILVAFREVWWPSFMYNMLFFDVQVLPLLPGEVQEV